MDTRQVEYFVAVAEEASFTAAASRLFAAQSTVSAGVRALETALGTTLLERSTRRVALTAAGEAFLPEARALLAALARGREAARASGDVLRGTVRIGTLASSRLVDLPSVVGAFHDRHPHVDVRVTTSPTGSTGLADDLRRGRLDIALVALAEPEPRGLSVAPLARIPYVALLPPGHPLTAAAEVSLAGLAGEPFVDTLPGFGNRIIADRAYESLGAPRRVVVEVADLVTVAEYVVAGLGVAVIPRTDALVRSPVTVRPLTPEITQVFGLATAADRLPTRAARALLDLIGDSTGPGTAF